MNPHGRSRQRRAGSIGQAREQQADIAARSRQPDRPTSREMEQQDPDEIRDDIDSSPTEEPQEPPITVEPTYKTSEWVMDNFGNGDPLSLTIKRGTEHAGTVTAQVVDTEVGVLKVEFDPAIYVFDKDVQDELAGAIGRRVLPAVHLPRYSE